jgi:PilZ domain
MTETLRNDNSQTAVDHPGCDALGKERRRQPRRVTFWAATVRTSRGALNCHVVDVSDEGAQLRIVTPRVAAPVVAQERVMLTIAGVARVLGDVVWSRRNAIGVHIADPIAIAAWRAALEKDPSRGHGRRVAANMPRALAEKSAAAPSKRLIP